MFPTALTLGMLCGVVLGRHPRRVLAIGLISSLLFGAAIAVGDDSVGTAFAACAIAGANFAVGALVPVVVWFWTTRGQPRDHGVWR